MLKSIKQLTLAALVLGLSAQLTAVAQKSAKKPVAKKQQVKPAAVAPKPATTTQVPPDLITFARQTKAPRVKTGDIFIGHISAFDTKGGLLQSTHAGGQAVMFRLNPAMFKGDLFETILKMGAGDSANIFVPSDSLFRGIPADKRPPGLPEGSYVNFGVLIEKSYTNADYDKEQEAKLMAYAKSKGLTLQKLPSGLMYVITQPGTGPNAKPNDVASVHYTGKLLDETVFDSSVPRNTPYDVKVATGSVIKGWDEGLQQFNKGAKGFLFIPYQMAYGEQGSPPKIKPFDPLVFEIEITDLKPAGQ